MKEIKYSIIIPAYNCENEIKNAVESITAQNYDNYEIIIVNDGSSDRTPKVIKELSDCNNRIQVINQKNSGPATARNNGISYATGDYILFIDSDDKFRNNLFNTLNEEINAKKPDMIIFGFSQIFNYKNESVDYSYSKLYCNNLTTLGEDFPLLYKNNLLNQVWNKAFSRKFIANNNIKFKDYKYGEDRLFVADALNLIYSFSVLDGIFYDYIIDSNESLISSYYNKKFDVCKEIYLSFSELNIKCNAKTGEPIIKFMFLKSVVSCLTVLYSKKCSLNKKEKKEEVIKILNDKLFKITFSNKINFGLIYNIIRVILCKGNYFTVISFVKTINFTNKFFHSIFLKIRK